MGITRFYLKTPRREAYLGTDEPEARRLARLVCVLWGLHGPIVRRIDPSVPVERPRVLGHLADGYDEHKRALVAAGKGVGED